MYNEVAGAQRCVTLVCAELARLPRLGCLIVVDDGSVDGTTDVLRALEPTQSVLVVVRHDRNRGYGAALRTGVLAAHERGCLYALFMDSDLTNDPADIPRFVELMNRGVDVIKGTRYRAGGSMQGVPRRRRWLSTTAGLVARCLFRLPLSDCTNGFRAVKIPVLIQMSLTESGFPVIVEELYHCVFLARRFAEIPVALATRPHTLRATSFPYTPSTFYRYLRYCVLAFLRIPPARGVRPSGTLTAGEN
jgi:glycosyltransferase involved in cell wall biosynthesis